MDFTESRRVMFWSGGRDDRSSLSSGCWSSSARISSCTPCVKFLFLAPNQTTTYTVGNYLFTARSPRCFVGQMKQKVPCSHHALVGPKGHLWNVFIMQLFHLPEDLSSVKCVKPTGQVISLHLLRLPNPLQLLMVWPRPSPLGDPPIFVDGKSCHDNSPNDTRQHWWTSTGLATYGAYLKFCCDFLFGHRKNHHLFFRTAADPQNEIRTTIREAKTGRNCCVSMLLYTVGFRLPNPAWHPDSFSGLARTVPGVWFVAQWCAECSQSAAPSQEKASQLDGMLGMLMNSLVFPLDEFLVTWIDTEFFDSKSNSKEAVAFSFMMCHHKQ